MSFYTSLSGLKGAQTDLATISNNIANVGTVGFKKSRVEFGDIISSAPLQSTGSIAGQGTRLKGISQQFTQGAFESSDRALDLAVSGQGFFVTRGGAGSGQISFTRNGSFSIDSNRYVADSSGAYLQVMPVDQQGQVTATGLTSTRNLQLPLTSGQPKSTTSLNLSLSLPSAADLPAQRGVYNSNNAYAFDRFDANSYNQSTATSVYDALGNPIPATIYFTRTKAPDSTDQTSTWEARLFVGNEQVSADPSASVQPAPLTLTFAATGTMTAPTSAVTYDPVQPSGAASAIGLTVDFGTATRQAATPFTVAALAQDGYAAGKLDNVTVGPDGLVTASFSNGTTQALGKVVMANFSNPAGLRQLGDAHWAVTGNSGEPIIGEASSDGFGTIQAGSLERANVDITEELVALISAQRNFQANAKAIETANTMTDAIVNLRT